MEWRGLAALAIALVLHFTKLLLVHESVHGFEHVTDPGRATLS